MTTISSCGGGGGGKAVSPPPANAPTIVASVVTFGGTAQVLSLPQGYNTIADVQVQDPATGAAITTATVTIDGTPASYVVSDQLYEAILGLNTGVTVTVSVSVNGVTYTASHQNYGTYPAITAPTANTTWSSQQTNLVSWTGTPPDSTSNYSVGVLSSATGGLVWPAGGRFQTVQPPNVSTSIPAGGLGAGSYLVLVGLVDLLPFSGAATGSELGIGGFAYAQISVTMPPPPAALESLTTSPANVTVGVGKSAQLAATASYTDGSQQDVTTQATWSSSDITKVTVSGTGLVTGVATGSAIITARDGPFSANTAVVVFTPNPSPAPPLGQSVAYQIDYAHSGYVTVGGAGPTFPPTAHWSITLAGSGISYPIIADGKVFVTTNAPLSGSEYGDTTLYAIDEATGNIAWGPVLLAGLHSFSGLTYDHGILFAVNFGGLLQAFDPSTGTPRWSTQLMSEYYVASPPTAVNGIVFVDGRGLHAVDEASGNELWMISGGDTSPTLSPDGVFVSTGCSAFKLDPIVGSVLWNFQEACSGGGGRTPAYANGDLYARVLFDTSLNKNANLVLDAETGKQLGTFSADVIPAFSSTAGFFLSSGTLTATDLSSGKTLWAFSGDGHLVSAPIVIDSVVVIGSASGTVYALDANTGASLWSGSAGGPIGPPNEEGGGPLTGLGAGEGYLVVPAGNVLSAWRVIP
jgi:outer membrane protein assembly factor BamB